MATNDIAELLQRWDDIVARGKVAIEKRDFDAFQVAFHDSCRCFEQLKTELESPRRNEIIAGYLDAIHRLGGENLALSEKLQCWMAEEREQAQNLRKEISVDRKITGAYGYFRKSGNILRVIR